VLLVVVVVVVVVVESMAFSFSRCFSMYSRTSECGAPLSRAPLMKSLIFRVCSATESVSTMDALRASSSSLQSSSFVLFS
jgi:hypothetical protein